MSMRIVLQQIVFVLDLVAVRKQWLCIETLGL